jgi:hypothetical protein
MEYCISASIMVVLMAVLLGVTDLSYLMLVFLSFFLLQWLGLLSELAIVVKKQFERVRQNVRDLDVPTHFFDALEAPWYVVFLPHLLGWVVFVCVAAVFVLKFELSIANSKAPGWVTSIYAAMFALMSCFGAVQSVTQVRIFRSSDSDRCRRLAIRGEYAYTTLSLAAKSTLAWVLYFNVLIARDAGYGNG